MNAPHRLTELRHRKQLTRQELARDAHVSERQLARIETGHVRLRKSTLERLAKALDVAPEVIVGAQPLPEADNEVPSLEIDSDNLKALRKEQRTVAQRVGGQGWSFGAAACPPRVVGLEAASSESDDDQENREGPRCRRKAALRSSPRGTETGAAGAWAS